MISPPPSLSHPRLIALNYLDDMSVHDVYVEHAKWGIDLVGHCSPYTSWPQCSLEPDRPLRIGYISPDFFTHSVPYFIEVSEGRGVALTPDRL